MDSREAELIARDATPAWKNAIASASESILVVSPFLDKLLAKLFKEAQLPPGQITVLTDLSETSSALTYRNQILALLDLLEVGVKVRSADRIHAKLLVIDGAITTIGSQNFTNYARRSKEVSTIVGSTNDRYSEAIVDQWVNGSIEVTSDFLYLILEGIEVELSNAENAEAQLNKKLHAILTGYLSKEREEYLRWRANLPMKMRKIIQQQEVRNRESPKYARIRFPYDAYYQSLISNGSDLTSWATPADDKDVNSLGNLMRLNMYPILFSDTGIMGFARVSKSRITYIRSDVVRGQTYKLLKFKVKITVTFPNKSDRVSNIRVSIGKNDGIRDVVDFELRFDGETLILVSDNIDELLTSANSDLSRVKYLYLLNKDFWESLKVLRNRESELKRLFIEATKPFIYDSLGSDNHNITSYTSGTNYRIGLVGDGNFLCLLA